jgi:hypothetical protein
MMEGSSFFDLPGDLRDAIWARHRRLIFDGRRQLLHEQLLARRGRWHVGIHTRYTSAMPE